MSSKPTRALLAFLLTLVVGSFAGGAASAAGQQERVGGLNRIYAGDDGGALYLRHVGGKVYGFGEHPGLKYAYVLTGSVSGDRITAEWWDVPKGTRTLRGSLTLRFTQLGARIVRVAGADLGPDVFRAIPASGIPWPNMQVAGFQSTTRGDLDGVFVGEDASRHYVREVGGDTVWFGESIPQLGARPTWATVFIGTRGASGTGFSGVSVDVPKGVERRSSPFGAALVSGKREVSLSQPTARRTTKLVPDYAVDWGTFETRIRTTLTGNVVGFAYALARDGGIMRIGSGGRRRLGIDGGARNFTTETQAQTASAAKTINAAAVIMALHARGLTVDSRVKQFLPDCLKLHANASTLTFRQILSHTSGLSKVRCNGGSPFDCLVKMLSDGRTESRDVSYNTHAYDLLRWLVPLVDDPSGMKAQFELFDCKNTGGILNRKVSEKFARYVFDRVLKPVGARASFYPAGDFSLNYDFSDRTKRGEAPRTDFFERAGSGKLTMSVRDYVRFLTALEQGRILPKPLVESMKGSPGNRLGFDNVWNGRTTGGYVWKNGGCPDFGNQGRGCQTAAMIFPSGIVAYVAVNSSNNGFSGSIQGVLANAFDAALR